MTVPCKQHWCSLTHLCTCIQLHKDFFWPDLSISRKGSQNFLDLSVLAHNEKRRKPSRLWKRANRRKNRNRVAELQQQANFMHSDLVPMRLLLMVSRFQWKPLWLTTQHEPQNDMTGWQNRVNFDVFAIAHDSRSAPRATVVKHCVTSQSQFFIRPFRTGLLIVATFLCAHAQYGAFVCVCLCVCVRACVCVRVGVCVRGRCARTWALRRGSIFRMTDSRLFCWF